MVRLFNEVLGKEIIVPDRPERIISLSPAITETLFLLSLGNRIIGVSAFCARPEEAKTKRKVGSYSTASLELLKEMKPDLVLAITGYQRNLGFALSSEFPTYPITLPLSVAGIIDMVVKVGLVVGEATKARGLSSLLITKATGAKPSTWRPRVYVEIDLGGPVSFGAHSYITDALHLLGASTLFDDVRSEWLTPDLARVAAENPDVFFYEAKMYSKFSSENLESLIDKRSWRSLKAVKGGRYYLTPGPFDFLAHHGPSFITEAIPWLSERLLSG
jgi:ABC-type Fe3+-hydroxamate transport system substrate-binding protein